MIWQDVVLAIGGWLFAFALLPSLLRSNTKPARETCLLTAGVLTVFVVVYVSLGLMLAMVSTAATALCWWILLAQGRR